MYGAGWNTENKLSAISRQLLATVEPRNIRLIEIQNPHFWQNRPEVGHPMRVRPNVGDMRGIEYHA
jgi:hypothetical protein